MEFIIITRDVDLEASWLVGDGVDDLSGGIGGISPFRAATPDPLGGADILAGTSPVRATSPDPVGGGEALADMSAARAASPDPAGRASPDPVGSASLDPAGWASPDPVGSASPDPAWWAAPAPSPPGSGREASQPPAALGRDPGVLPTIPQDCSGVLPGMYANGIPALTPPSFGGEPQLLAPPANTLPALWPAGQAMESPGVGVMGASWPWVPQAMWYPPALPFQGHIQNLFPVSTLVFSYVYLMVDMDVILVNVCNG